MMRRVIILSLLFFVTPSAYAQNTHNPNFIPENANEPQLREHSHYNNKYGEDVHSPALSTDGSIPTGATAQCRDGEYSFSHTSSGTCSRHGGVGKWYR